MFIEHENSLKIDIKQIGGNVVCIGIIKTLLKDTLHHIDALSSFSSDVLQDIDILVHNTESHNYES